MDISSYKINIVFNNIDGECWVFYILASPKSLIIMEKNEQRK